MAYRPTVIEHGISIFFAEKMMEMQAAREQAPGIMAAVLSLTSSSAYEKLNWLGAMPAVRQWIGELDSEELESYEYTVKNLDWAVSATINENDIADDQTGMMQLIGYQLAQRIMRHPEELAVKMLIKGDTEKAYDGVRFFSNATGARKIDNMHSGTGTTLKQLEADLNKARVAMARFSDDKGHPLNIRGNLIVCPMELASDFERLVLSDTDATGAIQGIRNPYRGLSVIGTPLLSADDATDWYLLGVDEILKPLIFSYRQPARGNMEKTQHTKNWVYSADYRGNGAYGLPHLALKVVN